jgi:hypothetical protein
VDKRNSDNVFQLSLTEIALIFAFLLLLLIGYLYNDVRKQNEVLLVKVEESQKALDDYRAPESYEELRRRYDALKANIARYLHEKSIPEPKKILDDLVSLSKLDKELEDLREALSTERNRTKVCEAIQKEGMPSPEKLQAALDDQRTLARLMNDLSNQGIKAETAEDIAFNVGNMLNEIKSLRNRCGGGGIGPCWIDDKGRSVNLLDVTLEDRYATISVPSLPPNFQKQFNDLPAIDLATRAQIPYDNFEESFGPILQWSKSRNPECRHYVSIQSNIPLTKDSKPRRLQIQKYFYPNEFVKFNPAPR